jgi:hypothetical protein
MMRHPAWLGPLLICVGIALILLAPLIANLLVPLP